MWIISLRSGLPGEEVSVAEKPSLLEKIVVGEAANQGPEGMRMVLEVMRERALASGKSLEDVAVAPKQFSASAWTKLDEFYSQQPQAVRDLAGALVQDVNRAAYEPRHTRPTGYKPITNYVTNELYSSDTKPSWVDKLSPAGRVGDHILLGERE
jgi:hypothetical protein